MISFSFSIDPDAWTLIWVSFVVGWMARYYLVPHWLRVWIRERHEEIELRDRSR